MLDTMDKLILNTLQENGRIKNSELSKIIGISAPATLDRVKKLERSGAISHFSAVINPEKIGFTITAMVSITLNLSNVSPVSDIKEKFAALDEVVECYQVAGANDFILKVVAKDLKAYGEFMNQKLPRIEGIQHVVSSFIIDNVKKKKMFVFDLETEYGM
jgi:Lrp/AsnC family leucine-responsive transcriptional regulator